MQDRSTYYTDAVLVLMYIMQIHDVCAFHDFAVRLKPIL